ncbi:uncharacterized protein LOC131937116 [Physella acuta]|uniref:uncharacterized protein LOC131937116 n=1 Tax=Physella acuta TaxID=109671 RepID=UPI0027DDF974|nr:uncharacterized protein LOC131937116 [Physella acuta]
MEPRLTCVVLLVISLYDNFMRSVAVDLYPHGSSSNDDVIKPDHLPLNNNTIFASDAIHFSAGVPFKRNQHLETVAHVLTNGVIVFGEGRLEISGSPDLKFAFDRKQSIVAPFWADIHPSRGKVYYHLYEKCEAQAFDNVTSSESSPRKVDVMSRAEKDIVTYFQLESFETSTVLVATWVGVQPYSTHTNESNTFQAVFVSGWPRRKVNDMEWLEDETSYAVFVYQSNNMTWPYLKGRPINIGVTGDQVKQMANTNTSAVSKLDSITGNTGLKGVLAYQLASSTSPASKCHRYLCNHVQLLSNATYQTDVYQQPACPCTLDRLGFPWQLYERRGDIHCYVIGAVDKLEYFQFHSANKLCCYKVPHHDCSADLGSEKTKSSYMSRCPDSGHVVPGDPWTQPGRSTVQENVEAHQLCCAYSSDSLCGRFYKIFPESGCSTAVSFGSAYIFGDPHVITFDSYTYTLNELGEFTLMNVSSQNFELQMRTERARNVNGTFTNATIVSAIAAREGDNSILVEISPAKTSMLVSLNGKDVTHSFYQDENYHLFLNNISILRECSRNKARISVTFPCGVTIKANTGVNNLELVVEADKKLMGQTKGLLGTFNNNTIDEIIMSNGAYVDGADEKTRLTLFAGSWRVGPDNSTFKYVGNHASLPFNQSDFSPLFSYQIQTNAAADSVEYKLCGADNKQCVFDYLVTQDVKFATNTRDFMAAVQSRNQILGNKPPCVLLPNEQDLNSEKWIVTQGKKNILTLNATDSDHDNVIIEVMDLLPDLSYNTSARRIEYFPNVSQPIKLSLRAKDERGSYSSMSYIQVAVCLSCSGRGQCDTNSTLQPDFYNGYFETLKCICDSAYTGPNCETELNACDSRPCSMYQNCTDLPASDHDNIGYKCGPCPSGFVNLDEKCVDIDECQTTNYNQGCTNTEGSFECLYSNATCNDNNKITVNNTCSCNVEHIINVNNPISTACEFPTYGENCSQVCECNGRGVCDPVSGCRCDVGWTGTRCDTDVDECVVNGPCPAGQLCWNTNGSFICYCPLGYVMKDGQCTECEDNFYGSNCLNHCECGPQSVCNKINGSCACIEGWEGDNCDKDVDECAEKVANCSSTEVCVNTEGGFVCECQPGWGRISDGCQCEDLDLCSGNICLEGCVETKENTSFVCVCNVGKTLNLDGVSCSGCARGYYGPGCVERCSCAMQNTEQCNKVDGTCGCSEGWNGSNCELDIDECQVHNICQENSYCINTNGSFSCVCHDGYFVRNASNQTCEECDDNFFGPSCQNNCSCGPQSVCNKTDGTCSCSEGWKGDKCDEDVDECAAPSDICNSTNYEKCTNTPGGFTCNCIEGRWKHCNDCECIECPELKYGFNCSQECGCVNSLDKMCDKFSGSCRCEDGWNGLKCDAECENGTFGHNCSQNCSCVTSNTAYCNKVNGSCVCKQGWTGDRCQTDVDECGDKIFDCPEHSNCVNTNGSYDCDCIDGFKKTILNKTQCIECENGKFGNSCSQNCNCVTPNTDYCNKVNGSCVCKQGWTGDTCQTDVDECRNKTFDCPEHSNCVNTNGSYGCDCIDGFKKTILNKAQCIECENGTFGHNCSQNCSCVTSNTDYCNKVNGSCVCKQGWTGDRCQTDFDECGNKTFDCPENSNCVNTNGSYDCDCIDGFKKTILNKAQCIECENGTFGHNCSQKCSCVTSNTDYCNKVNGSCVCKQGWTGDRCQTDVDECGGKLIDCPEHSNCVNTNGSYDCDCIDGFKNTIINKTQCIECENGTFGHNCSHNCSCVTSNTDYCNTVNGSCVCKQGWTGDRCQTDFDECGNKTFDCPEHSNCINTNGSYDCDCIDGFKKTILNKAQCIECENGTFGHNCSQNCSCVTSNTDYCNKVNGSCVCKQGWTGDRCQTDFDECGDKIFDCPEHSDCVNTNGSYDCDCIDGFKKTIINKTQCIECENGTFGHNCSHNCSCVTSNTDYCNTVNGSCVCKQGWTGDKCQTDFDECGNKTFDCPEHSNCINTIGSYDCDCIDGFKKTILNKAQCIECENGTFGHNCSQNCSCVTSNTDYCNKVNGSCVCKQGWTGDRCQTDVDECGGKLIDCPEHSNCINTNGSYDCDCIDGYKKTIINKTQCIECENGTFGHNCSQNCSCVTSNTDYCNKVNGSCVCKQGWTGDRCQTDFDECGNKTFDCPEHSNCINTNGSYDCDCIDGFKKTIINKTQCIECENGTFGHNCYQNCSCVTSNTDYCNKVNGSCVCKQGWTGDRCQTDVDECGDKIFDCPENSECMNNEGSYDCSCKEGFSEKFTEKKVCEELVSVKHIITVVTFQYNASLSFLTQEFSDDYKQLKYDVEINLLEKLKLQVVSVLSVTVNTLKKGSLIANSTVRVNILNKADNAEYLIANAFHKIMLNEKNIQLKSTPAPILAMSLNGKTISAADKPCDVKIKMDPCNITEKCQQIGEVAKCIHWQEKDHNNFIIGLSVGVSLFVILILTVAIIVYIVYKKKSSKIQKKKSTEKKKIIHKKRKKKTKPTKSVSKIPAGSPVLPVASTFQSGKNNSRQEGSQVPAWVDYVPLNVNYSQQKSRNYSHSAETSRPYIPNMSYDPHNEMFGPPHQRYYPQHQGYDRHKKTFDPDYETYDSHQIYDSQTLSYDQRQQRYKTPLQTYDSYHETYDSHQLDDFHYQTYDSNKHYNSQHQSYDAHQRYDSNQLYDSHYPSYELSSYGFNGQNKNRDHRTHREVYGRNDNPHSKGYSTNYF